MENRLHRLFDFQKLQGNPRLAQLIAEAERHMEPEAELDDDDLSLVAAAGELTISIKKDSAHDA